MNTRHCLPAGLCGRPLESHACRLYTQVGAANVTNLRCRSKTDFTALRLSIVHLLRVLEVPARLAEYHQLCHPFFAEPVALAVRWTGSNQEAYALDCIHAMIDQVACQCCCAGTEMHSTTASNQWRTSTVSIDVTMSLPIHLCSDGTNVRPQWHPRYMRTQQPQ